MVTLWFRLHHRDHNVTCDRAIAQWLFDLLESHGCEMITARPE